MDISQKLRNAIRTAFVDPAAASDMESIIELVQAGGGGGSSSPSLVPQPVIATNVIEATAGIVPTAGGSTTIADAAAPTVSELLDLCVEQQATIDKIVVALSASGVTL